MGPTNLNPREPSSFEILIETGVTVLGGDKQVGTMGSTAGGRGLALVRIDRVADALDAGLPLTAGGLAIRLIDPNDVRTPPKQTVA